MATQAITLADEKQLFALKNVIDQYPKRDKDIKAIKVLIDTKAKAVQKPKGY